MAKLVMIIITFISHNSITFSRVNKIYFNVKHINLEPPFLKALFAQ